MARPRPQEQVLLDLRAELRGTRVLCTSAGYAQLAAALARERPEARVVCHWLDLYQAEEARERVAAAEGGAPPPNLELACAPDFPEGEFDLVALPLSSGGEADLARDLLQMGHERLRVGGLLAAATDNRDDRWLHEQVLRLFGAATRRPARLGTAYIARKTAPLRRRIDFTRRFAFRDRGRLIQAVSRPGVFSHGRADPGARALLERMEVFPGARVLDIGCGSGVLSLAAAARASGVAVLAVDSSARAVACTAEGARLNGLESAVRAELLAAAAPFGARGGFDLALANPPYYAQFRIAERFLEAARAALAPGGRLLAVTKMPDWYREHLPRWFPRFEIHEAKGGYTIVEARVIP